MSLARDGNFVTVTVTGKRSAPGLVHAQHLHGPGMHECPTIAADTNHDGLIATLEAAPDYGPIVVSLTTTGDTSPRVVSRSTGSRSPTRTATTPTCATWQSVPRSGCGRGPPHRLPRRLTRHRHQPQRCLRLQQGPIRPRPLAPPGGHRPRILRTHSALTQSVGVDHHGGREPAEGSGHRRVIDVYRIGKSKEVSGYDATSPCTNIPARSMVGEKLRLSARPPAAPTMRGTGSPRVAVGRRPRAARRSPHRPRALRVRQHPPAPPNPPRG